MATRFTIESVFKAIDNITAPVAKMQQKINSMTRGMSGNLKILNTEMDNISNSIKRGFAAVTVFATATGVALWDVIKVGAKFEQTLVNAAAKFPEKITKGTAAFKELEDAARDVGRTTEFTASQAAEAINFLAAAGFSAKSSVGALKTIVDLATAAEVDLGTASNIATDMLGAFSMASEDAAIQTKNLQRVTDVLAKTANTSNASMQQLYDSMQKAGPIATAAGVKIETVASLLGIMSNAGIKAEVAGTAVANMFLNLTAPSSGAVKTLKKLGIAVLDSKKNLKDMPIILGELQKKLKPLTEAKRLEVLESIFGREGLAGAIAVINNGAKAFEDYRKVIQSSGGSTKELAAIMRDTLEGRLKSLESAIESVKISFFSLSSGPLNKSIEKLTEFIKANEQVIASKLGEYLAYLIDNFGTLWNGIKNIGIGIGIFIAFSAVLNTFIGVMTAVNLVMAMNPIGLLIIGIGFLIGAFASLIIYLDDVEAYFDGLGETAQNILAPIRLLIDALQQVKEWGGQALEALGLIESPKIDIPKDFNKLGNVHSQVPFITQPDLKDIKLPTIKSFEDYMQNQNNQSLNNKPEINPQIITPQDRFSKQIQEVTNNNNSNVEVTIKDETGKAQITKNESGNKVKLQSTGAF